MPVEDPTAEANPEARLEEHEVGERPGHQLGEAILGCPPPVTPLVPGDSEAAPAGNQPAEGRDPDGDFGHHPDEHRTAHTEDSRPHEGNLGDDEHQGDEGTDADSGSSAHQVNPVEANTSSSARRWEGARPASTARRIRVAAGLGADSISEPSPRTEANAGYNAAMSSASPWTPGSSGPTSTSASKRR